MENSKIVDNKLFDKINTYPELFDKNINDKYNKQKYLFSAGFFSTIIVVIAQFFKDDTVRQAITIGAPIISTFVAGILLNYQLKKEDQERSKARKLLKDELLAESKTNYEIIFKLIDDNTMRLKNELQIIDYPEEQELINRLLKENELKRNEFVHLMITEIQELNNKIRRKIEED